MTDLREKVKKFVRKNGRNETIFVQAISVIYNMNHYDKIINNDNENINNLLIGLFPIEHSDLYQFWLAEKEEIMKNKYYLSEKAGYDVGYDFAIWNWYNIYRAKWLNELRKSGKYPIQ